MTTDDDVIKLGKPVFVLKYWIFGAGILLLCLGLLLGWSIGVRDGSKAVGIKHCTDDNRYFLRVEKDYTINCSTYQYKVSTLGE